MHRSASRLLCLLLLGTGCGREERFPLRDRAARQLGEARPVALAIEGSVAAATCEPRTDAPFVAQLRCDDATTFDGAQRTATLAGEITAAPAGADREWALALIELTAAPHDRFSVTRAITRLTTLLDARPHDALLRHHRAIGHVARAAAAEDPRDLLRALDDVDAGLAADSTSVALHMDRGLLLAAFGADSLALREFAWVESHAEGGALRAEAQRTAEGIRMDARARRTASPLAPPDSLIRADAQRARDFVLDSLLPRWHAAAEAGDTAGRREAVALAAAIGGRLLAINGDSSVFHIASDLAGRARPQWVSRLVAGMRAYGAFDFETAAASLRLARTSSRDGGATALAAWAALLEAGAYWQLQRYDEARASVDRVHAFAVRSGSVALQARALWLGSLISSRSADLGRARPDVDRADSLFRAIGEIGNAAFLMAIRSEHFAHVGQPRQAARDAYDGLRLPSTIGRAPRHEQWLSFSDRARDLGASHAALALLDEALVRARASRRSKDAPETLARRARLELALGRRDAALGSIAAARPELRLIPSDDLRRRTEAELDRAEAAALQETAPDSAVALLLRATRTLDSIPLERAALRAQIGEVRLRAGDQAQGIADLRMALALAEARAASVSGIERRSARQVLRTTHRELARIALDAGDSTVAIGHLRSLLGLPAAGSRSMRDAGAIPKDAARLWLVALRDRVVALVETSAGLSLRSVPVADGELESAARALPAMLRRGADSAAVRASSRMLFDLLIAPHLDRIGPATRLVLLTDEVLGAIPFAALRDSTGTHLIERYALEVAVPTDPSRAQARGNSARRGLLLVSDPAWDRVEFPDLEPLPYAAVESDAITALVPDAQLLVRDAATRDGLGARLGQAEVLHFAGHAIVDDEAEGGSHLVLAGRGGAGRLTALEIARFDLRGLRLAVLSSCGRLADSRGAAEPVNELAQAFLGAGARTTVASLWEVEDAAMARVMGAFYRELQGGAEVAEALRRAQVQALKGSEGERRAAFAMVAYAGMVGEW